MSEVLARAWAGWKAVAHRIGNFQARVLLSVFYFVAVPPFALIVRMFQDPLRLRSRRRATFWLEHMGRATSPEASRRQY